MSSMSLNQSDSVALGSRSGGEQREARYERRAVPRRRIGGYATGVVSDTADPTRPKRICALELMNISDRGLGALSGAPLPVGGRIALFVTAHGVDPGMDLRGTVVRCQECEGGYDVGVTLNTHRRAA